MSWNPTEPGTLDEETFAMTDKIQRTVELKLTPRELTHIRVAMLHRLDKLKSNSMSKSYGECLAMMQEGGVLCVAMRQSRDIR